MEVKRPKRLQEETEDDLMLLQEEFLKGKSQPSVQVVREKKVNDKMKEDVPSKIETMEIDDSVNSKLILSEIREKDPQNSETFKRRGDQPPKIEKLDKMDYKKASKNKSLFAQQLEKQGKLKKYHELQFEEPKVDESMKHLTKNQLITGEGLINTNEAKKIHDENIQKLACMSKEEILKEQQRLLNSLDPKIISFVRKRKQMDEVKLNKMNPLDESIIELPKVSIKDLPVSNEWIQSMGKIEYEKLAWTGDLPNSSAHLTNDNTATARFGFDGRLIEPGEDIPVIEALHHHGNEPERAGYSLEELYHLARSNLNQQRALALTTIANIVRKSHEGEYEGRLKDPLLQTLINGGVIFLLRWCLDDQTECIILATLEALSNLIQPVRQEDYLDYLFVNSYKSFIQSSLYPYTSMSNEDLKELNDLDYLKVDTLKGLLKMNLLARLKYLVGVYRVKSVDSIFLILFRIARHSSELCYALIEKFELLDVLFENFLPITWSLSDHNLPYNRPHSNALKLIRLICQGGHSMSMNLYKRYQLKSIIIRYLLVKDNDKLVIEAINLLHVLCVYGIANDFLMDSYELILNEIKNCIHSENTHLLKAYLNLFCVLVNKIEDDSFKSVLASLCCSIFQSIVFLVKQNVIDLDLQAICYVYLSDYLCNFARLVQPSDVLTRHDIIQQLYEIVIKKTLQTENKMDTLLSKLSQYSIKCQNDNLKLLKSNNLSYLPTFLLPTNDFFRKSNPFYLLTAFIRLFSTLIRYKIDLDYEQNLSFKLLNNDYLKSYLRHAFLLEKSAYSDSLLNNYENIFAYYLVKFVIQLVNYAKNCITNECTSFYHSIAFSLVTQFKTGDEFYLNDLFLNVIFNQTMWSNLSSSTSVDSLLRRFTSGLNLCKQQKSIKTASGDLLLAFKGESDLREFEKSLIDDLTSIKMNYLNTIFSKENQMASNLSRSIGLHQNYGDTHSCFSSKHRQVQLFVNDWIFMPILIVLQSNENSTKNNHQVDFTSQTQIISQTLKFILLCELYRSDLTSEISPTIRFVRLLSIFLTDSQVFLDRTISKYLYIHLLSLIETSQSEKLKFDTTRIEGIMSFSDFYKHLLNNYESVSFGDRLYALYLLAPMQQYCSCKYRKLFWAEFSHLLSYFRFDLPSELAYPIEAFLKPYESDLELIEIYFRHLLEMSNKNTTSLGYLIALNHVNSYLFDQNLDRLESKRHLMVELDQAKYEQLRNTLIRFKQVNSNGQIEYFDNLPEIRLKWLKKISSLHVK